MDCAQNETFEKILSDCGEPFFRSIETEVKSFLKLKDVSRSVLVLPPLGSDKRYFIHQIVEHVFSQEGLTSFSIGTGYDRRVTISKKSVISRTEEKTAATMEHCTDSDKDRKIRGNNKSFVESNIYIPPPARRKTSSSECQNTTERKQQKSRYSMPANTRLCDDSNLLFTTMNRPKSTPSDSTELSSGRKITSKKRKRKPRSAAPPEGASCQADVNFKDQLESGNSNNDQPKVQTSNELEDVPSCSSSQKDPGNCVLVDDSVILKKVIRKKKTKKLLKGVTEDNNHTNEEVSKPKIDSEDLSESLISASPISKEDKSLVVNSPSSENSKKGNMSTFEEPSVDVEIVCTINVNKNISIESDISAENDISLENYISLENDISVEHRLQNLNISSCASKKPLFEIGEPSLQPGKVTILRNPKRQSGEHKGKDECDWESLYDDSGDCLHPALQSELADIVGDVKIIKPLNNYNQYQSLEERESDGESIVEIYGFPSTYKTQDLMTIFGSYITRGFYVKWVDETHALGVFSSVLVADEVLSADLPNVKIRPLRLGLPASKEKARKLTIPTALRPKTCAAMAKRLVSGALGLKLQVSMADREAERKLLREAREQRRLAAKQRDAAWEGTLGSN